MTIETITMDREAARAAYREYQAAVRAERRDVRSHWRAEDVALARGYRQLAKGRAVLNLHQVMKTAGLRDDDGFPKLAIAPSHFARVSCQMGYSGGVTFGPVGGSGRWGRWLKRERVSLQDHTFDVAPTGIRGESRTTLVPIIPPALRPKTDLTKFHTLWEVESWTLEPPRDPFLLRHLGGELYVVLAVWDLTALERAVLGAAAI